MKFKVFSELVLLAASILCVFIIGVILFAGGSFIEGVSDGHIRDIKETLIEFFMLLSLLLFVLSVVVAWVKRLTGSILMTVFSIIQILLIYEPEIAWMQISILFTGPLLFLFVRLDRRSVREKS